MLILKKIKQTHMEFKGKINAILQKFGSYRPTDQTEITQLSYPTK